MNIDLAGRTALVTGGSRGIGRACAVALAAAGADVVVGCWRSAEEAEQTAEMVRRCGQRAVVVSADVADAGAVEMLFGRVEEAFGGLDILVNNAGVSGDGLVGMLETSDWDRVMEVNLRGPFLCTRAAIRHMIPRRSGKIVNLASLAALRARAGIAAYAASKGGVAAFTRACAVELASKGIQVNAVLPGWVDTEMTHSFLRRSGARLRELIPAGRLAEPEEVAALVVFLASPRADYITGQAIVIDGGLSVI